MASGIEKMSATKLVRTTNLEYTDVNVAVRFLPGVRLGKFGFGTLKLFAWRSFSARRPHPDIETSPFLCPISSRRFLCPAVALDRHNAPLPTFMVSVGVGVNLVDVTPFALLIAISLTSGI